MIWKKINDPTSLVDPNQFLDLNQPQWLYKLDPG
jgi:hypothetical protein